MSLNSFINDRVGFGKFQVQCFIILCLIDMNDGVQIVLSSFLNPIIEVIYPAVTKGTLSLMASIFYMGSIIGSLTSGTLADQYGRRKLIGYGSVMQLATSIFFYFAANINIMLFLRFLYGFSFGFTIALTTSLFAEVTPEAYRGKGILLINFFISIGKLFGVVLGYVFIEKDLSQTNWQLMMACGTLPNLLVLVGTVTTLEESPRYLMTHSRMQEGICVLNRMIASNKDKDDKMTQLQAEEIREEFRGMQAKQDHKSYAILLNKSNIKKTIGLSLCWIIINLSFYGQLVIEALHLHTPSKGISLHKYFFTVLGEAPSLLVSLYLIDHPSFGRRKSLIYFFLGAAVFHLGFAFSQGVFMAFLARFFMKNVFQIIYPLTTESFETKMRTKGFGFCSGAGRMGAIMMPFILIPMDSWSRPSVYVLFCGVSIVASWISQQMIEQTMNKALDEKQSSTQVELIQLRGT